MFKINRYSSLDEPMWDNFVPNSNNGTIFHLRSFLNYHPNNRFTDHSLIIEKKGKAGPLIFVTYSITCKTKNGEPVLEQEQTRILR